VDRDVRLEHDAAGGPAAIELMEQIPQRREARLLDRIEAEATERRPVSQVPRVSLAAVQIRNDVQSVQLA
jgi:hypothetical protein